MNLLIRNIRVCTRTSDAALDIRIHGGRVLELGAGLGGRKDERALDLGDYLAVPGLINSHDHLGLNLFPRLGSPPYASFYEWGREIYQPETGPVRDILRVPLVDRLLWGAYKQLLSGVTTVVHHDPFYRHVFTRGFPVNVVERYGWSHSLGFCDNVKKSYKASRDKPFIIHAAEGRDDEAYSEIDRLDELGVLGENTVVVHGIAVSPAQRQVLADRNASLVWCPVSNLHLYGRTADVDGLKERVQIALGTDSTLSGSPTLWHELQTGLKTGLATSSELFEMVTTIPAKIFRLADGRGTIREGGVADILILPDRGGFAAECLLSSDPTSIATLLVNGIPALADTELASKLDLGPPNTTIMGKDRWIVGSIQSLRARIEKMVNVELLSRNPLWNLVGDPMPEFVR